MIFVHARRAELLHNAAAMSQAPRTGHEVVKATAPFAKEDRRTSWRLLATTFAAAFAAALLAASDHAGPFAWLGSLILGLVFVRIFIFYHDALHGAVFKGSRLGMAVMNAFGVFVLTPPRIWRDSHNYHHAHTAKLVGSNIGSFPVLTVRMYRAASPRLRLLYRLSRHPLNMALGYLTVFIGGMCIKPFLENPKRYWASGLALVVHGALIAGLWALGGPSLALRLLIVPLMVACGAGAYLFYAQHNFPDVEIKDRTQWDPISAALYASSMIDMSPLMHWFTGNIGYHHVHHLNARIPFYRLPEAMAAVPELAAPHRTSLAPRDVLTCLRGNLWDPVEQRMVTYAEAEAPASPRASATAA